MVGFIGRLTRLFLVALFVFGLGTLVSAGEGLRIHLGELPNGIKMGFLPLASSHALIQLRVGAGFVDEGEGETGVAHWLEHGVFRGTKRFPTKELFERELSRLGIEYNASTTFERTSYYFVVPKERLPEAISLFVDMIAEPMLDPAAMKAELEPVKQEARRDMVNAHFDLFLASMALHGSTPRMSQIMTGTPAVMDMQPGYLPRKFYNRWYSASNMTVAVIGGMDDPNAINQLMKTEFARIKKFHVPPRGSLREELNPRASFVMYKVKAEPGSRRLLNVAFPMSYTRQNEAAAAIFAKYMNRADSPLDALMVESGLADSTGVSVETFQDVIYVRLIASLTAKGEASLDAVHLNLAMGLGSLQKKGVPEHVLGEMKSILVGGTNSDAGLKRQTGTHDLNGASLSLGGLGEMITDGLAQPDGASAIMAAQKAISEVSNDDVRWLLAQMSPEKAQITLRTPNANGTMNPAVEREVETIDLKPLLPTLRQAYVAADLPFDSEPNRYLMSDGMKRVRNEVEVGKQKIKRVLGFDLVFIPAEEGGNESALLEFRFPKLPMKAEEIVGIEVALKAFELERGTRIFLDRIQEADIDIGFRLDKSEMRLYVTAKGPSKLTAKALEEFLERFRGFVPTKPLVERAIEEMIDSIRALPLSEVSRQAVSAGIKKITGGRFIDPQQKIALLQRVRLPLIEKLVQEGQKSWAVRGVISSNWDDATIREMAQLMVAPNPIYVKGISHKPFQSTRDYKPLEVFLSGVNRQGVARLYPVGVAEYGVERFALEVFADVLSSRLMATVRTEMKLAYAVGAGFAVLPAGAVVYMTADTSKPSTEVLAGYDEVMRRLAQGGMTEDEFRNALFRVARSFAERLEGVTAAFNQAFGSLDDPQKALQELGRLSPSRVMLIVNGLLEKSRKLDSVVAGPNDPICEKLLLGASLKVPAVQE